MHVNLKKKKRKCKKAKESSLYALLVTRGSFLLSAKTSINSAKVI